MKNTLLLIIDLINDIVHTDSKVTTSAQNIQDNNVLDKVNHAIQYARKNNLPIVHTKIGFSPNYIECPTGSPLLKHAKEKNAFCLNTWGTEFHKTVDVKPEDTIMTKHRVSALYATPLECLLRANHISTVIICGVSTDMAIESTVRELHDRDYNVIVLSDACGAASEEIHQASLKSLKRLAIIQSSDELIF